MGGRARRDSAAARAEELMARAGSSRAVSPAGTTVPYFYQVQDTIWGTIYCWHWENTGKKPNYVESHVSVLSIVRLSNREY